MGKSEFVKSKTKAVEKLVVLLGGSIPDKTENIVAIIALASLLEGALSEEPENEGKFLALEFINDRIFGDDN